jgi:hypothetical protein
MQFGLLPYQLLDENEIALIFIRVIYDNILEQKSRMYHHFSLDNKKYKFTNIYKNFRPFLLQYSFPEPFLPPKLNVSSTLENSWWQCSQPFIVKV